MATEQFRERLLALQAQLEQAGIPIEGVALIETSPPTTRVHFAPTATAQQRTQADGIIAAFDWSQAAHDAAVVATQRSKAAALLTSPEGTFKLLRAVGAVLTDEINLLRSIIPRPIVSITRSGTVATVTTFVAHGLTTGATVFITGATVAAYNGQKTITVTGATTFTYAVAGSPATPAAGSMTFVLATVTSLDPRTPDQINTAIQNKLASGVVDQSLRST